jgi:hypothetical protein
MIRIWSGDKSSQLLECISPEKIICIDGRERTRHFVACTPNRVARAPGFFAFGGQYHAFGQTVQELKCVAHLDLVGVAGANLLAKDVLKITTDYKYHATKTSANRIEHCIIQNGFSTRPHGIELFESPETGPHTGG